MTVHPLCPALATAERRQMVVMFCDIAGSSALAARMDAESFGALIVAYRRLVAATVERHGGRVARYVGDGVLACWGHPRARDDDAQRALAAALAIRAAFAPSGPHALSLRIALDAGFVIVGDLAAGAAQSADVVGEAPNAAAELQAAAAPGEALVTDSLRALAGHAFVFESLGERRLKARAAPEAVFRLARAAAPAPETPGPLIGRGRELDRLLAAWRRAAAGRGGALLIEGEAGIGKTALVDAFRRRLGTAARWLAFDAGRGRLTRDPQPEPEGLIVLAENVDRADAPTRAALLRLAHLAPDAPLLVIMTARSGESGALRKVAERLAVPRLDKAARTSLVAALDRRGRLSARARQRIADLSGGLPSLARDLIDCGGALDSPALDPANLFERPSRLAAWLAARLDDFGPLRRVACIAATLGPSADVGTTARLAGMEARVLEARLRAVARCGAPLRLSPGGRVVFEDRLLAAAAAATTLRAQRRLWLAQARATQPIDRDFAVAG